jgi:hypothetical protein
VRSIGCWLLVVGCSAAVVVGCGRCGKATVDAGTLTTAYSHIDLRTALFTVFPEFRGARLVKGEAVLTRKIRWTGSGEVSEALNAAWKQQAPFFVRARADALEIGVPITDDDVPKLLQTPAPMGSEQLRHYLPALPGAQALGETFTMTIEYEAKPDRAAFLTHQLVDILTAGEWRADALPTGWQVEKRGDGGVGAVPEAFTMSLTRSHAATRITIERNGGSVKVQLVQPLPD